MPCVVSKLCDLDTEEEQAVKTRSPGLRRLPISLGDETGALNSLSHFGKSIEEDKAAKYLPGFLNELHTSR